MPKSKLVTSTGVGSIPQSPPPAAPSSENTNAFTLAPEQLRALSEPLQQALPLLFATAGQLSTLARVQEMVAMGVVVQHRDQLTQTLVKGVVDRIMRSALASQDPAYQQFGVGMALRLAPLEVFPYLQSAVVTTRLSLPSLDALVMLEVVPPEYASLVTRLLHQGLDGDPSRRWALEMVLKMGTELFVQEAHFLAGIAMASSDLHERSQAKTVLYAMSELPEIATDARFISAVSRVRAELFQGDENAYDTAAALGTSMIPDLEAQLRGPNAKYAATAIGLMGPVAFELQCRVMSDETISQFARDAMQDAVKSTWSQNSEFAPQLAKLAFSQDSPYPALQSLATSALLQLDRFFAAESPGAMAALEYWPRDGFHTVKDILAATPQLQPINWLHHSVTKRLDVVVSRLMNDFVHWSEGDDIDVLDRTRLYLDALGLEGLDELVAAYRQWPQGSKTRERILSVIVSIAHRYQPEFVRQVEREKVDLSTRRGLRGLAELSQRELIHSLQYGQGEAVDNVAHVLAQLGPSALKPLYEMAQQNPTMAERAERVFGKMGIYVAEGLEARLAAQPVLPPEGRHIGWFGEPRDMMRMLEAMKK